MGTCLFGTLSWLQTWICWVHNMRIKEKSQHLREFLGKKVLRWHIFTLCGFSRAMAAPHEVKCEIPWIAAGSLEETPITYKMKYIQFQWKWLFLLSTVRDPLLQYCRTETPVWRLLSAPPVSLDSTGTDLFLCSGEGMNRMMIWSTSLLQ